jgi:hypothetical protein
MKINIIYVFGALLNQGQIEHYTYGPIFGYFIVHLWYNTVRNSVYNWNLAGWWMLIILNTRF